MVFQDWALFPHLSVAANVGYGLPRRARTPRAGRATRWRWSGSPGSATAARRPSPAASSSGWRWPGPSPPSRRCSSSTSRSPTSTPPFGCRCGPRSIACSSELGITTVFVTHDQEEAFVLGDEVGGDARRPHRAAGRPGRALRPPGRPVGGRLRGRGQPGRRRGRGRPAPPPPWGRCRWPRRSPSRGRPGCWCARRSSASRSATTATVEVLEFYGHDSVYVVRLDDGGPVRVRIGSLPAFRPGDRVRVSYTGAPTVAYAVTGTRTEQPAVTVDA